MPTLDHIYKCFQGSDQEFKFLENSLPHKFDLGRLRDMNVAKLLEKNGKLASFLHKNKYPGKIDYSTIQGIESETDPHKIVSILLFLEENPDLIDNS